MTFWTFWQKISATPCRGPETHKSSVAGKVSIYFQQWPHNHMESHFCYLCNFSVAVSTALFSSVLWLCPRNQSQLVACCHSPWTHCTIYLPAATDHTPATVLLTDLTKITGREKYRNKGTSSEADHLLNMMEAMFEHSRDSGSIVLSEDVTAVGWIVKFTGLKFSRMWLNWSQCFTVQMDNDLKHTPKLTKVFLKERNGIFFNSETSQLNKLCCY